VRIVALLVLGVVLGLTPFIAGLMITPLLDWRLRALPQTILCFAVAGLLGWFVVGDRARRLENSGSYLGRHPRVARTLAGSFALVLALIGVGSIGDWLVPPRQLAVEITGWHHGRRGAHLNIHTTEGQLETPMLWIPTVEMGPARLTLGGVTGSVLLIEQPPP